MELTVSGQPAGNCGKTPARATWLGRRTGTIRALQERWSLTLEAPFDTDEAICAWVAPATRADGGRVVLKLGMPHMEGDHEIAGPALRLGESGG